MQNITIVLSTKFGDKAAVTISAARVGIGEGELLVFDDHGKTVAQLVMGEDVTWRQQP